MKLKNLFIATSLALAVAGIYDGVTRYDETLATEFNTNADIYKRLRAISESPEVWQSQTRAEREARVHADVCMSVTIAGIERKFAEREKELRESAQKDGTPLLELNADLNRLNGYRTGQAAVAGLACSQGYSQKAVEDLLLETEPRFIP
jgi:hypothetical protein